jgi:hypothetical protein
MSSQQSKLALALNKGEVNVRKSLRCTGEVVIKFPSHYGIADILLNSLGVVALLERKNVSVQALRQSNLDALIRAGHVEVVDKQ